MTVRELIALLEQVDPDFTVYMHGCDCTNPSDGVDVHDETVRVGVDGWDVPDRRLYPRPKPD